MRKSTNHAEQECFSGREVLGWHGAGERRGFEEFEDGE